MIKAALLSLVASSRAADVTEQAEVCSEASQEGCDEASLLQLRGAAEQGEMRKDDVTLGPFGAPAPAPPTVQLDPANPFGPLTALIGTWQGELGYNLVALPAVDQPGAAGFSVVANRFREQITFKPIDGGVLNRGYENANQLDPQKMENQTLLGLSYHLEDRDLLTGDLIHVEDGQWLWNFEPGVDAEWSVARLAEIPHGISPMALGLNATLTGDEVEKELQGMVNSPEWSVNPQQPQGNFINGPGYFDPERDAACRENGIPLDVCAAPVKKLLDDSIPFSSIKKAVKLDVKTSFPGGRLEQLPGITKQVFNTLFNSTFFVSSTDGEEFTQFQYVQTVMFHFLCTTGNTAEACSLPDHVDANIAWPHVQLNTLRKVKEKKPGGSSVAMPPVGTLDEEGDLVLPATIR